MAETTANPPATPPAVPPASAPAAPTAPAVKYVGKYESQEAFEKGIRELAKTVEYPIADDQPLIGEKGLFKDLKQAEAGYKAFARMNTRRVPDDPDGQANPDDGKKKPGDGKDPAKPNSLAISKPEINGDADIGAILTNIGVTSDEITEAWSADGKLTDDQYAKFAAKGYPKQLVNDYLHGVAARAQSMQQQVATMRQHVAQTLGGEAQETNLRNWAAAKLKDQDPSFDALNAQVETNPALYPVLIEYVANKHRSAVGAGNSRPLVDSGSAAGAATSLVRGSKEYFEVHRAARRGDVAAKRRLLQLTKSN